MTGLIINNNVLSLNGRTLVKAGTNSGIGLADTDVGLVLEQDKLLSKDTTGKGIYMYGGEAYYGDNIINSNGRRFVVPISREDYDRLIAGEKIAGIGSYSPSVLYYINGSEKKEYSEKQYGNIVGIDIDGATIAKVANEYKVIAEVSNRAYYGVGDRVIVRLSAMPVSPVKLVLSGNGVTFDDYDITFDANNWYVNQSVGYSVASAGKCMITARVGKEQTNININIPEKIPVFIDGKLTNGATVKSGELVVDGTQIYIGKGKRLQLANLPINPNRVQELYFVVSDVSSERDDLSGGVRYIPDDIAEPDNNAYVANYWRKSFSCADAKNGITEYGGYAASFNVGRGNGNFVGINHIAEIVGVGTQNYKIKEIGILDYGA